MAREFACERKVREALEAASLGLPFQRLVYLGAQEEKRRGKVEWARRGLGRFLLAMNTPDSEGLPAAEVLGR